MCWRPHRLINGVRLQAGQPVESVLGAARFWKIVDDTDLNERAQQYHRGGRRLNDGITGDYSRLTARRSRLLQEYADEKETTSVSSVVPFHSKEFDVYVVLDAPGLLEPWRWDRWKDI